MSRSVEVLGLPVSMTVKQLREVSEDELIRLHDRAALNTLVGTARYLDELHRHQQLASMQESH